MSVEAKTSTRLFNLTTITANKKSFEWQIHQKQTSFFSSIEIDFDFKLNILAVLCCCSTDFIPWDFETSLVFKWLRFVQKGKNEASKWSVMSCWKHFMSAFSMNFEFCFWSVGYSCFFAVCLPAKFVYSYKNMKFRVDGLILNYWTKLKKHFQKSF